MSANRIVPDVLALLVCDQIIIDRMTGKTSLIGLFSNIAATEFPVRHPRLCIFASLTDGRGVTPLEIAICDSEDEREPVVTGATKVEFKDPRAIANFNLHFSGLVFPEPGHYRVQLKCQGELLREARLRLARARPRQRRG